MATPTVILPLNVSSVDQAFNSLDILAAPGQKAIWRGKSVYQVRWPWQTLLLKLWKRLGWSVTDTTALTDFETNLKKAVKDRVYTKIRLIDVVIDPQTKPAAATTAQPMEDTAEKVAILKARIIGLQSDLETTKSEKNGLQSQLTSVSNAKDQLGIQIREKDDEIQRHATQISSFRTNLDALKNANEKLRRQIEDKDQEIARLTAEAKSKEDSSSPVIVNSKISDQLKEAIAEKDKLQQELAKVKLELNIEKNLVQTKDHEIDILQQENRFERDLVRKLKGEPDYSAPLVGNSPAPVPTTPLAAPSTPSASSFTTPLKEVEEGLNSPKPSVKHDSLYLITNALAPFLIGTPTVTRKPSGAQRVLFTDGTTASAADAARIENKNKQRIHEIRREILSSPNRVDDAQALLQKVIKADNDNHHELRDCLISKPKLLDAKIEDVD